jgi:hypothetical protein
MHNEVVARTALLSAKPQGFDAMQALSQLASSNKRIAGGEDNKTLGESPKVAMKASVGDDTSSSSSAVESRKRKAGVSGMGAMEEFLAGGNFSFGSDFAKRDLADMERQVGAKKARTS